MAEIVEKRVDLRDVMSTRAKAPKRKARQMYKQLTKSEKAMLVKIINTQGAEAAKAMANLILATKKAQRSLKRSQKAGA